MALFDSARSQNTLLIIMIFFSSLPWM